jgi:nicotinamidase-related amidase
MAVTALDPRTALIIVDLQKGVVGLDLAHPVEEVVANSRRLAGAFREHGLPVVLINVDGLAPGRTERHRAGGSRPDDWTELVSELGAQPTDIRVTKQTWGAFASTDLEQRLKGLGVTQVVITGIATTAGVESTARQAYEAGFNVALATDAMTDMSGEAHDCSVANVFPKLGETGTTDEILGLLDRADA